MTNAKTGSSEKLQALVEAKNDAFIEAGQKISVELLGNAELEQHERDLRIALEGGAGVDVDFAVQADRFFEVTSPYRTLVASIKASEIVALYNRKGVGNAIFTANVRLPLTTKKVNGPMIETARSEGSDFFYFNNGISAVCASYERDDNRITAKRFQIINGAQTVSALRAAFRGQKANPEDVYVLFRLTETTESTGGAFTEKVIRYNNTQNPIKTSDFFANDAIQSWLARHLTEKSGSGPMPAFYYVHKRGHQPSRAKGRRQLTIDAFAGIRHAFLYGPISSYKEPATFFERDSSDPLVGRYWEAFGVDGAEVTEWDAETLAEACTAIALTAVLQREATEIKKDPKGKDTAEAKYLYRLARYVAALVNVGLREVRDETFLSYETLISTTPMFRTYTGPVVARARDLVADRIEDFRGEKVQPEYALARKQDAWDRVSKQMADWAKSRAEFKPVDS